MPSTFNSWFQIQPCGPPLPSLVISYFQFWIESTARGFQKKPCPSLPLYALFPLPVSSSARSLTNFLHLKTLSSNTIFLCSIELDITGQIWVVLLLPLHLAHTTLKQLPYWVPTAYVQCPLLSRLSFPEDSGSILFLI